MALWTSSSVRASYIFDQLVSVHQQAAWRLCVLHHFANVDEFFQAPQILRLWMSSFKLLHPTTLFANLMRTQTTLDVTFQRPRLKPYNLLVAMQPESHTDGIIHDSKCSEVT